MRRPLAFIVVGALIAAAFILPGCGPTVPSVVGMRPADAVRTLQEAGYKLGDTSLVATSGVPLGTISAQKPAAGESAREGSPVSVAVNSNDGQRVLVPNVTGLAPTTAEGVANTLSLVPVVVEQYSDDVVKGQIGAQSPEPGAEVAAGSTLLMVQSKGPAPEKADVPDVKGDAEDDATAAIEKAGFTVEVFDVYDPEVGKGKVIGQVPNAGKSATVGSKVQIAVSLGKGTGSAKVPSVTGKKEAAAIDAIEDAGLKVQKLSQYDPDVAKGVVAAQFPDSGATAAKGSEVLIVVSKGAEPAETVAVPDVMGQVADQAILALDGAGFTVTVQEAASDAVGTVFYQFPEAGSKAAPGAEVLIVVGVAAATP